MGRGANIGQERESGYKNLKEKNLDKGSTKGCEEPTNRVGVGDISGKGGRPALYLRVARPPPR